MSRPASFDDLLHGLVAPLQNGSMALCLADATAPDTPIISINAAFTALTGYREVDAIGRNCRFLQGPGTDLAAIARLRSAIAAGQPSREVLLNYRRDGTSFRNEVFVTPIRDAAGRLRYFTGVQREYRTAAPTPDMPRRIRFVSLPDGTLSEWPAQGGPPPGWLAALTPFERRRLAHAATVSASRDLPLSFTLAIPDDSGALHRMTMLARATLLPEGVAFEGPIEPAPEDEATLFARLRLLEAVSRHANDAVLITEAEPLSVPGPRIVFANEAIYRHTGHRPESLIGLTPRLLQGPQTDMAEVARLSAALHRWESPTTQLLNYRADGSVFWNEFSVAPVADGAGWFTHWVSIQRDISERRSVQDRILHLATHDGLTGLATRGVALDRLERALEVARLQGSGVAVIRIDLDRFKLVNDTHGHAAGDAALVAAAERFQACLRTGDTAARIGGDEFLAIMPGLTGRQALIAAAERLRAGVAGALAWRDLRLDLSLSAGAALFPDDADDAEGLIDAADVALYQAKRLGRGRMELAWPGLRQETDGRKRLACEIRQGLEKEEFEPFFQPQCRLADGQLVGLEALVRWRRADGTVLTPGAFLDVADTCGLLGEIGERMLDRAIAAAVGWLGQGLEFGRIAVNLAADQLRRATLCDQIAATLHRHGLPAPRLTVEIVESVFVDDRTGQMEATLGALRRLGVGIELDDFGTGFASLTHLRRFPIDRIKIDRSFIADIGVDPDDEVIVSAVVQMASSLGLGCVAEGVETEAQMDFLRRIGCSDVQGYLISRPMDAVATRDWIAARQVAAAPRP